MVDKNRRKNRSPAYKAAGVDIDAGQKLVDCIAPLCESTHRPGVCALPNGFAGVFDLAKTGYRHPMLLSATDGVGSKIKLAAQHNKHDTIGQDLVAMCVNDILCCGGEPIIFLDYFACGALDAELPETVIAGIARACKLAGCALIGGETAELPGMYKRQEYELAGFAVGLVEKDKRCGAHKVKEGDKIIGLESSGPHANGYSLLRAIERQNPGMLGETVADGMRAAELVMAPTLIYVQALLELMRAEKIHAAAHVTGGGIMENLPRALPDGLQAQLHDWPWPPLFLWLQKKGGVARSEMLRVFNCGMGMLAIVADEHREEAQMRISEQGYRNRVIGEVVRRTDRPKVFFDA